MSLTRNPLQKVKLGSRDYASKVSISAILPVTDEPLEVWEQVLLGLKKSIFGNNNQILIVANGVNGVKNIELAKQMGFQVERIGEASKRDAVLVGSQLIKKSDITLILDSDTVVTPEAVRELVRVFNDPSVGGATPRHIIKDSDSNIYRKVSNWLEFIRFEEVLRGQSSFGTVSCLPGRLLAIRTHLLKSYVKDLTEQRFLGAKCISGDDRYLTSRLLEDGYKTVYNPEAIVLTEAPGTFKGFVLQRLRWSRTSFRETIRSLKWTFKYPYLSFTVLSNPIMRWFFFVVAVTAVLAWFGVLDRDHAVDLPLWFVLLGSLIGFFISGFFRQLLYLMEHPEDIRHLPSFLFMTLFVLTPVEWYGNLTVRESSWMTRRVK